MMDPERAALKAFIWMERQPIAGGLFSCELCHTEPATDMHEHWISRGQARGNDELLSAILNSKYNVSGLCNHCNMYRAETEFGRKLLRTRSIERYGKEAIIGWIETLP